MAECPDSVAGGGGDAVGGDVRPRLLDLFCGAGGAAMGYHRAGFDVVGVDISPQPRYPFEFHQADVMSVLDSLVTGGEWRHTLPTFAAIHASPPCQRYSSMTRVVGNPADHPDLVDAVRDRITALGVPYVIENVEGAPLRQPLTLCGSMFGLGAVCRDGGYRQLRRHRLFEMSQFALAPQCRHDGEPVGVYGSGGGQQKTARSGNGTNRGYMGIKSERCEAMGIDWMNNAELSQAIPPAYTEFLGRLLLA